VGHWLNVVTHSGSRKRARPRALPQACTLRAVRHPSSAQEHASLRENTSAVLASPDLFASLRACCVDAGLNVTAQLLDESAGAPEVADLATERACGALVERRDPQWVTKRARPRASSAGVHAGGGQPSVGCHSNNAALRENTGWACRSGCWRASLFEQAALLRRRLGWGCRLHCSTSRQGREVAADQATRRACGALVERRDPQWVTPTTTTTPWRHSAECTLAVRLHRRACGALVEHRDPQWVTRNEHGRARLPQT
jgi:hypothetical protein